MSPVTHFLLGWLVANGPAETGRRDRAMIAIVGVAPDLDGLGAVAEVLTKNSATPLLWFTDYHHFLCHNLPFCLLYTGIAVLLASRRILVGVLCFLGFHLHLICDLLGGRGPDGHQWPIHYLAPFSKVWEWAWSGQWQLNAWPNFAVTIAALAVTFLLAYKRGYSPLEILSPAADRKVVGTIRTRFGHPQAAPVDEAPAKPDQEEA